MPKWVINIVDIFHINYDSCVNNYKYDAEKIWGYIRHIERAQNLYGNYNPFKPKVMKNSTLKNMHVGL